MTTSYISVLEANTFFAEDLRETFWNTFSTPEKEKALLMATSQIDSLPFAGQKITTSQEREFPRFWYLAGKKYYWDSIDGNIEVPNNIKTAVCEQALFNLKFYGNASIEGCQRYVLQEAGVTSISLGGISESYDLENVQLLSKFSVIKKVYNLIQKYLLTGV